MFHKHNYVEIERTYYGPRNLNRVSGISPVQLNFFLYGRTVVTYKCECGRRTQDSLLGRVEK